jgi:hypothetical protein
VVSSGSWFLGATVERHYNLQEQPRFRSPTCLPTSLPLQFVLYKNYTLSCDSTLIQVERRFCDISSGALGKFSWKIPLLCWSFSWFIVGPIALTDRTHTHLEARLDGFFDSSRQGFLFGFYIIALNSQRKKSIGTGETVLSLFLQPRPIPHQISIDTHRESSHVFDPVNRDAH